MQAAALEQAPHRTLFSKRRIALVTQIHHPLGAKNTACQHIFQRFFVIKFYQGIHGQASFFALPGGGAPVFLSAQSMTVPLSALKTGTGTYCKPMRCPVQVKPVLRTQPSLHAGMAFASDTFFFFLQRLVSLRRAILKSGGQRQISKGGLTCRQKRCVRLFCTYCIGVSLPG